MVVVCHGVIPCIGLVSDRLFTACFEIFAIAVSVSSDFLFISRTSPPQVGHMVSSVFIHLKHFRQAFAFIIRIVAGWGMDVKQLMSSFECLMGLWLVMVF